MLELPAAAPLGAGVVLVVDPCSQQEPAIRKAPWLEMLLLTQLLSGSHSGCWLSPPSHPSLAFQLLFSKLFLSQTISYPSFGTVLSRCVCHGYTCASKINNSRKMYPLRCSLDFQSGFEPLGNASCKAEKRHRGTF